MIDDPVPEARARSCTWYLAEALFYGDASKIVPVESMRRGPPTLRAEAFEALGRCYPDQEIVWAVVDRGINPKDEQPPAQTVLGTNHMSGLRAHHFVSKANNTEKEKGHLFGFPISMSPPIHPAVYSPTGAVHKKLRDGSIDPGNMRPTSDFSWPPPQYWMGWLTTSVNDTIDLDMEFPYVHYFNHMDFVQQVMQLKELREPVL